MKRALFAIKRAVSLVVKNQVKLCLTYMNACEHFQIFVTENERMLITKQLR